MPVNRMKMRPWLELMLDSRSTPGLTWVDKEKTMFAIPWKHAARHGWELDKDAHLFKKWAIHTGKHVEGQTCDPKTWKANFRCAMNSLPDIEEVKDKSINKGHQAVRIFRMLPEKPKSRDKRNKSREAKSRKKISSVKMDEDTDYSNTQSPANVSPLNETTFPQENTIDSTVNTEQGIAPIPPLGMDVWLDNLFEPCCRRIEVSPSHTDYDNDDFFQLSWQSEMNSTWMVGGSDSRVFLNNEASTSPGSQWSEESSLADDLDDLPQYTTLSSDFQCPMDDLFNGSSHVWSNL